MDGPQEGRLRFGELWKGRQKCTGGDKQVHRVPRSSTTKLERSLGFPEGTWEVLHSQDRSTQREASSERTPLAAGVVLEGPECTPWEGLTSRSQELAWFWRQEAWVIGTELPGVLATWQGRGAWKYQPGSLHPSLLGDITYLPWGGSLGANCSRTRCQSLGEAGYWILWP